MAAPTSGAGDGNGHARRQNPLASTAARHGDRALSHDDIDTVCRALDRKNGRQGFDTADAGIDDKRAGCVCHRLEIGLAAIQRDAAAGDCAVASYRGRRIEGNGGAAGQDRGLGWCRPRFCLSCASRPLILPRVIMRGIRKKWRCGEPPVRHYDRFKL